MPVRPRKRVVSVVYRPDMPRELLTYRPGAWVEQPFAPAGTEAWERQHQVAYQRWRAEADAWQKEHGHKPLRPGTDQRRGDVPFCGELDDHDCLGAECPRRPPRNSGYAAKTVAADE